MVQIVADFRLVHHDERGTLTSWILRGDERNQSLKTEYVAVQIFVR